jgi:hypothetical protein
LGPSVVFFLVFVAFWGCFATAYNDSNQRVSSRLRRG